VRVKESQLMEVAMLLLSIVLEMFTITMAEVGFNNQVKKFLMLQLVKKDQCGLVPRMVKFSKEVMDNGKWSKEQMQRESVLDQMVFHGLLILNLKSSHMMVKVGRDNQEVQMILVLVMMVQSGSLVTKETKKTVNQFS